jgi:PAS domain S-box-containing protein
MPSSRVAILVADDRPENLVALRAILADPSYEILCVSSGAQALAVVHAREDLALVLLDVHMPGLDGLATARLIRDRQRTLPIIFLTADSVDERLMSQAYAIGAVDYLIKPLDPDAVNAKVAVFVDLQRKAEQIRVQEERLRALDRERNAEALRESEVLYEATFNQAPVGIAHLSPGGRWQRVNERFCALLNRTAGELLGHDLANVVFPDDVPALRGALDRMVAGAQTAYCEELRLLPQAASPVWMDVTLSILRDRAGLPRRVICIAQDISDRKRAEAAQKLLHEASELLMGSLDAEAALAGVAQFAVPRLADLCVVELADRDQPLAVVHADEQVADDVRRARPRATRPGRTIEIRQLEEPPDPFGPDDPLWRHGLRSLMRLPLDAHGGPLGEITLARRQPFDAVDLVLAEQLGHRAAAALESGLLYAQAQQAIRVRDEFLSIASHELRTPLTPLQIQLQRLIGTRGKSTVENLAPDRLRAILTRAEKQVERLAALIDNLLDVSRISSGRLKLEREATVDLAALVRDVAGRFSEELARAGCRLVLRADQPVVGRWDPLRLEQVVTNLISNAVKYGPGQPIEVVVVENDGKGVLRVADHGIGIPAEKLDKIFDRFERAVSSRSYGGLGLGLYITRQIVEAHGGHVAVASEIGKGAVFTVELSRS